MFKSIPKRYWLTLLIAFIAFDIALTFWQNYQLPLDGDMVNIVLPAPRCVPVLEDPFGWSVITENAVYTAPNRFFAHASMVVYWKQVPHLLQAFFTPISSLYVTAALFNTAIQSGLLFLLAAYVQLSVGGGRLRWGFWLAAAMLVPLFQTQGFYEQMGVVDQAVTYTFFYGLPTMLLLILFWPFYKAAYNQQPMKVKLWQAVLLVLLMVVVSFNGPIAMAAVAVLLFGIGLYWLWGQWRLRPGATGSRRTLAIGWLSGQALGLLFVLGVLNIYSLYIGRNDAENTHIYTLWELYQKLPMGIYLQLSNFLGLPLLILLVVLNGQLVRWLLPPSPERTRVLYILRGVGLFALVFVALVPFGGYRVYRPNLIRYDTIISILLGLFFAYGVSSYYLILHLRPRIRGGYIALIALVSCFYVYSDAYFKMPRNNDCERWAFEQLQQSTEPVTHLYLSCSILSWGMLTEPQKSETNADMLQYWGVTNGRRPYYQQ